MAEIDVQPKKQPSWLPWLIGALLLIGLLFFLLRSCNTNNAIGGTNDSTGASVATTTPAGTTTPDWSAIDRNAPAASYEEITNKDIGVRGNENYSIYSLGENILFDEGKSTIRPDAEQNLKELAASINKRFPGGDLRIYGYTDATGNAADNKRLAEDRAEAVRTWLLTKSGLETDVISLNPVGEDAPVATNSTEAGRQQNRRVEIVARRK